MSMRRIMCSIFLDIGPKVWKKANPSLGITVGIGAKKIDGAIATIMELDHAIRCGNDTGASLYDSLGLLFI